MAGKVVWIGFKSWTNDLKAYKANQMIWFGKLAVCFGQEILAVCFGLESRLEKFGWHGLAWKNGWMVLVWDVILMFGLESGLSGYLVWKVGWMVWFGKSAECFV